MISPTRTSFRHHIVSFWPARPLHSLSSFYSILLVLLRLVGNTLRLSHRFAATGHSHQRHSTRSHARILDADERDIDALISLPAPNPCSPLADFSHSDLGRLDWGRREGVFGGNKILRLGGLDVQRNLEIQTDLSCDSQIDFQIQRIQIRRRI